MPRHPPRRPMHAVIRAAACLLALLLVAGDARADVIVLDASGAGHAVDLQTAVDMAVDGDFVLVRPGFYTGPQGTALLADKRLTIVGDVGGPARINSLHIAGLSPNKRVILRGLQIVDGMGADGPALQVDASPGVVYVEDCLILGEDAPTDLASSGTPGMPAVMLSDALRTSFHRTTIRGGDGADFTGLPGDVTHATGGGQGLFAERSTVAAYACDISGGAGGDNPVVNPPGPGSGSGGGEGVGGIECVLDFVGTTVTGGDGGNGCLIGQEGVCAGGPAVSLDPLSILRTIDSNLAPGLPGLIDGGGVAPPNVAVLGLGSVTNHGGTLFQTIIESPKRTGEAGLFSVTGEPGAIFAVFLSVGTDHLPLPGQGVFHLPVGPQLLGPFIVAVIPGTGSFDAPFLTPSLAGPGLLNLGVTAQAMVEDNAGRLLFAGPTAFLIVDASF